MLALAKVVEIHPEAHEVDVEFMADGRRCAGVKVLSGAIGTNFGINDLARPANPGYGQGNTRDRDIYAAIGMLDNHPVVVGFLAPEICEMTFPDVERMVYRHPSDVYVTITQTGDVELAHPSGTFFRIGASPSHEDLTGKDFDKKWKIRKNTRSKVYVHLEIPGKGVFEISPDGEMKLWSQGKMTLTSDTAIALSAPTIDLN